VDRGEYLSGVNAVAVGLETRRGVPMALWAVGFAESMGKEKIAGIIESAMQAAADLRSLLGMSTD
jgi:DNA-binding IclR family transcriptional regulator